jgi:hypothetical protein
MLYTKAMFGAAAAEAAAAASIASLRERHQHVQKDAFQMLVL